MKTPFGAWRVTYTPGRWVVLSGPTSLVVMQPAPATASKLFAGLWDKILQSSSVSKVGEVLAASGLDSMPNLAVFFWDDDQVHSLLRGEMKVFDADSGEPLASGSGARTWFENSLTSKRICLRMDDVDTDKMLQLPLVVGGVQASVVFLDATDPAGPQMMRPDVASPSAAMADGAGAGVAAVAGGAALAERPIAAGVAAARASEPGGQRSASEPDSSASTPASPSSPDRASSDGPSKDLLDKGLSGAAGQPGVSRPGSPSSPPSVPQSPASPPAAPGPMQGAAGPVPTAPAPLAPAPGAHGAGGPPGPVPVAPAPIGAAGPGAPGPVVPVAPVPIAPAPIGAGGPTGPSSPEGLSSPSGPSSPEGMPSPAMPGVPSAPAPDGSPSSRSGAPGDGPMGPQGQGMPGPVPQAPGPQGPGGQGLGPKGPGGPQGQANLAIANNGPATHAQPAAVRGDNNFGKEFDSYMPQPDRPLPNTTGPWGIAGFGSAASPVNAGVPIGAAPVPEPPSVPNPPRPSTSVRRIDAAADHDGETVYADNIASTHKPAAGRNENNLILAALCPSGHANQPGSTQCRVCGGYVESNNPQLVNSPLLTILETPTGDRLPLNGPILVGRAPTNAGNDLNAELLRIPSPNHDVSRTHMRIAPHEWIIEATDLYSTNGTVVVPPGGKPMRLEPGQTVEIAVGTRLDLGDGQMITLQPPA